MGIFRCKGDRLFLICLSILSLEALAGESARFPFLIIVNPHNPVASVDRRFLVQAFLKKSALWPQGDSNLETIQPVDLTQESPVRRQFSEKILGRSVTGIKNYWQQAIFSGRDVPPPEFSSDDEVVKYVADHEGSIGYVSPQTEVSEVKVVTVR